MEFKLELLLMPASDVDRANESWLLQERRER